MKLSRARRIGLLCVAVLVGLAIPRAGALAVKRAGGGVAVGIRVPQAIAVRPDASALERLAAQELRRYVYLRTGALLPVRPGAARGDRIAVARADAQFCGAVGQGLGPQAFVLQTTAAGRDKVWWVVGGDEVGALYGAYRLAEQLGVRFGLDGDAVPDEPLAGAWPEPNETGRPRFALRGLQPFHDFSVGPDWWNLADYRHVLSQMAKLRLNFIGLHTYPSWNSSAGPEANVWIGLPEDVDAQGNVRWGYEAGVVTTRKGWAVQPFPTSRYAAGAGLLFEADDYGPDYMLDCLDWPKTAEAAAAMFNRYGDFQQQAFAHARRLGIKTCTGTELPLGVPPALVQRLQAQGLRPDDPAVIRRLYEGTFLRVMRKTPVDYFWFWAPEIWLVAPPGSPGWEIASAANVERDLGLIPAAAQAVHAPFGLATGGWRLGTQADARWFDRHTPKSWAASSINTALGRDPVEQAYGAMRDRPRWVIGWSEDDGTAGAHCCTCWDLQFTAERLLANAAEAHRYSCEGLMAIHWRTAAIAPNIAALAQAGWSGAVAADTNAAAGGGPDAEAFWAEWGRGQFGGAAGAEAGRLLRKFDGRREAMNALVNGGAHTTDADLAAFFAPLAELEALRPRLQAAGNLERCDYWLNFIRATRLRVRTWVLAARLAAKVGEVQRLPADQRPAGARQTALPLRLELARSYEDLIAAFVQCAKSPGEVGTIASIESGNRQRIVHAQDQALERLLGAPLPAAAAVSSAYRGAPRIFVSAPGTQVDAGAPLELRAFVLSAAPCAGVTLRWRPLGAGAFRSVAAAHRARQAYRVNLPEQPAGAVEYYLEAALDGGAAVRWPATAPARNQTATVW